MYGMKRVAVVIVAGAIALIGQSLAWALDLYGNYTLPGNVSETIYIKKGGVFLNCNGKEVKGNKIKDVHGIVIDKLYGVTVSNCKVTGWDRGISVDQGFNVRFYDNEVSDNDDGYEINSSEDVAIYGGKAFSNRGDGVDIDYSREIEIRDMEIFNNTDKGITVNSPIEWWSANEWFTIWHNQIHHNGTGIRFEWVTGGHITQNEFDGNKGANILFKVGKKKDRVSNVSVYNNTCRTGSCTATLEE